MPLDAAVRQVVGKIEDLPAPKGRRLVAIAGPPASGKSTLAARVAEALPAAAMVPMDGFHLDNRLLDIRGLRDRKGAPETFDVAGFRHLLTRLREEHEVVYPLFDRGLDCAIAGAGHVDAETRTVVIEGNYLLLDAPGWRELRSSWDFSVYLSVPHDVLRDRLLERWHDHGYGAEEAMRKVSLNDLPNVLTTEDHMLEPDFLLANSG